MRTCGLWTFSRFFDQQLDEPMPWEAPLKLLEPPRDVDCGSVRGPVTATLKVGGGSLQLRVQDIGDGHERSSKGDDGDAVDRLARESVQAETIEF